MKKILWIGVITVSSVQAIFPPEEKEQKFPVKQEVNTHNTSENNTIPDSGSLCSDPKELCKFSCGLFLNLNFFSSNQKAEKESSLCEELKKSHTELKENIHLQESLHQDIKQQNKEKEKELPFVGNLNKMSEFAKGAYELAGYKKLLAANNGLRRRKKDSKPIKKPQSGNTNQKEEKKDL